MEMPRGNLVLATTLAAVGVLAGTNVFLYIPGLPMGGKASSTPGSASGFFLDGPELPEPARSTPASASISAAAIVLALGGFAVRRATAQISLRCTGARSSRPTVDVVACHAFENELGVQAPVGFFDPLGFTKDGDESKFKRRRASELKHGRISMLACMGYITPEYCRFPGYLSYSQKLAFTDMPNGLEAMSKLPLAGGLQMFLWGGFIETVLFKQEADRAPGDFANAGNLGIPAEESVVDPEKRTRSLNSELANGRLAMMAIMGMMFQNGFIGTTGPDMWIPSAFEAELGVQAPLGYFDPLGLSSDGDADTFYRRRCSEIKHGRVSMWAVMGYIAPEYFRWPGYLSPTLKLKFDDIPSGLQAFSKVPAEGWTQIFLFCGFMEIFNAKQDPANPPGMLTGADGPFGGVHFGNLGVFRGDRISDADKKKRGLNSELANGRLAMAAITGMMFQNGVTGTTGPEMWFPAAFESELGAQAPVGFFDPLGFTKDGDASKFKRRRASELKHGRISMLACMGYIAPEYFRFPGYLSYSKGLTFADMPNGLEAMAKMPLAGGLQMFLWGGFIETILFKQDGDRAPGDFTNAGNLGIPYEESVQDPEKRKRSLNSELANGRLAMVAITGMMFQNGFIGTTGPDMWIPSAFEDELGVQAPLGYFDPLGLSKDGDTDTFYRRRCSEIKHGRVSMWAVMGYIAPEYFRWPGQLSPSLGLKFSDIPSGLQAFSKVPAEGWAQIFAFCGFMEVFNAKQDPSNPPGMLTGNEGPFGKGVEFGNLGIFRGDRISDPEKKKRGLNSELANGRLAMAAITGMMFQNGVTGTTGPEMWFPTGAFENELGVQAPVGFFDPLGFTKDGDASKFKRRRASELKHGRISMLACMGYIAPEYFRLPGYLSYSKGLTFADMPNGLEAMAKVPLAGGLQMFLWGGFIETILFKQEADRAPGDFANAGNLGIPAEEGVQDPEKRKRSLNSELANGRLAMMAIMGMMFQNGFIGTTGPDMWIPAAFEGELGVQAPLGYWDPLGLSSDGDVDVFYRRRCSEIKHGRVAMWAAMGFIIPEYFRWPGYLSPSLQLKFDDVPSGLQAFSKVPAAGWAQIFFFCGFMEIFNAKQDPANPPGMLTGNEGPFGKGVEFGNLGIFRGDRISDPERKKRGLNSELANGRLAMAAITGMLFQNGVTGTTGPEMWAPGAFENELGVQAPVGFFDPLGFTKDGDSSRFKRHRASELKHGRISMLACMGYITPEYFRFPGYLSYSKDITFASMPNGLEAMAKVPLAGGLQMFLWGGFIETILFKQEVDRAPGDFANAGNLGIPAEESVQDPEKRKRSLNSELANGRLAMMAIMGMMFQNGFIGTTGPDMWIPSAFEGELGVQAPLGYFDPLGLSKDGDTDTFYRRRCTEIKHGRVSMWAAMGYITPEYIRWPGYLSPSENLKFEDVPSGLQAFSKVPAAGWTQIFLFCGFMEIFNAKQDPSNPPGMLTGNDGPFGGIEFGNLGVFRGGRISDPEKKKRGLNSELANGRLAMAAITGMMFQNGVTGTTGPEMWFPAASETEP